MYQQLDPSCPGNFGFAQRYSGATLARPTGAADRPRTSGGTLFPAPSRPPPRTAHLPLVAHWAESAHHQQAQSVERQANTTREVWTALDEAIARHGWPDWPDRMLYARYPAAMGNRLRRATYQADAALGEQQAQRDIRELVRVGRLGAKGEAQGRYHTAGPELPEAVTRGVREPRPLRGPCT